MTNILLFFSVRQENEDYLKQWTDPKNSSGSSLSSSSEFEGSGALSAEDGQESTSLLEAAMANGGDIQTSMQMKRRIRRDETKEMKRVLHEIRSNSDNDGKFDMNNQANHENTRRNTKKRRIVKNIFKLLYNSYQGALKRDYARLYPFLITKLLSKKTLRSNKFLVKKLWKLSSNYRGHSNNISGSVLIN